LFDKGQHILAFDKFGLAVDKRHGHPTDDGAYWREAVILTINKERQTATIRWKGGGESFNKPLSEIKQFGT